MRLAITCGYAGMGLGADTLELVREAERLGYAQAWVAEAYGSDAPTVLAWLAAQTSTIGLGAGIMQIPARTPAMTAMTAATLDTLSAGRFHLGLGVSGPQVSEGWHGVRFGSPLGRTRVHDHLVGRIGMREPAGHDRRDLEREPVADRREERRRERRIHAVGPADEPRVHALVGDAFDRAQHSRTPFR